MLFEEADFAGMRLVTVVFVQRWNDFLADVQELRFQADEHARHHRLPRFLVDHPPTPVLQLIRARQDNRRLDAVAIYAAGGDVILNISRWRSSGFSSSPRFSNKYSFTSRCGICEAS